jgi:hypothetical protein
MRHQEQLVRGVEGDERPPAPQAAFFLDRQILTAVISDRLAGKAG